MVFPPTAGKTMNEQFTDTNFWDDSGKKAKDPKKIDDLLHEVDDEK